MKKTIFSVWIVIAMTYFAPMVLNHSLLVYWGDELEQLIPHLYQFVTWIQSGHIPAWNASIGLGSDSLVGLFISMGSPFTWIAALFPRNWLPFLLIWFDLIRFSLIAFFSYLWLKRYVKSELAIRVGVFIITFSGYMMCWIHYAPFIDPFMGFVMVLYLADEALEGRKKLLFSLSILFTILLNPYYFYMFSWYLILYLSYRVLSQKPSLKSFFTKAIDIALYYLLGVGLSAVILFPVGLILASAPRLSPITLKDFLPVLEPRSLYAILTSFFSPVVNDYLMNLFYSNTAPTIKLAIPHVYPLVIGTFMALPILKIRFEGKRSLLIFSGLMFSVFLFPVFYKVFNGIMDVRWVFMIIFTYALVIIQVVEHASQVSRKEWMLNGLVMILLIIFFFIVTRMKFFYNETFYATLKWHVLFYIVMTVAYVILFAFVPKRHLSLVMTILLILEGSVVIYQRMYTNGNPNYMTLESMADFDQLFENPEIQALQDQDKTFYRVDVQDGITTQAAAQNFPGFLMYMSTYNFETQTYYNNRFTPMRKLEYSDSKNIAKTILGSKYFVSNTREIPYGYDPINSKVALNRLSVGLGYASDHLYSESTALTTNAFIQDVSMFGGIFTQSGHSEVESTVPVLLAQDLVNGSIDYQYHGEGEYIIDFSRSNPYATCTIDYSKDGNVLKTIKKDDYGYLSVPILEGANKVYFYCSFTYNENEYVAVDVYEVTDDTVDSLYASAAQHDYFYDVVNNEDQISAKIDVSRERSVAFTTIAYDKGWEVKVDGKKVETQKVNFGFLGFDIDSGTHTVELVYTSYGQKVGWIISVFSLFIFIVLTMLEVRKRKLS